MELELFTQKCIKLGLPTDIKEQPTLPQFPDKKCPHSLAVHVCAFCVVVVHGLSVVLNMQGFLCSVNNEEAQGQS